MREKAFWTASADGDRVAWQSKLKHLFDRISRRRQDLRTNSIRYEEILFCRTLDTRRDIIPFFSYRNPFGLDEWCMRRHGLESCNERAAREGRNIRRPFVFY